MPHNPSKRTNRNFDPYANFQIEISFQGGFSSSIPKTDDVETRYYVHGKKIKYGK